MIQKRIWLLAVLLSLVFVPAMADKYTDQYGTTFVYKVKNGTASIRSMSGNVDQVRIPGVIDKNGRKIPVKSVDFYESTSLYGTTLKTTVLQIEEGIERIGEHCFADFSQLYEVYIPSSVKFIGKNAFRNGRNILFSNLPPRVLAADLLAGNSVQPAPPVPGPIPNPIPKPDDDPIRITGKAGESDVDKSIPFGGVQREKTFCLIIANEKYLNTNTNDVSWAETDGNIFYKYCIAMLGIPQENITFCKNADFLTMKTEIEGLGNKPGRFGADAKFIFYYAGHGAPDDNGKCYLIPCNGSVKKPKTGYPLSDVYGLLGSMASSSLVLVDACFSGCDRHDVAMVDGKRGIGRVQEQSVVGNVVAITAASNDETALAYDEKAHGLFTYYLLKALKEKRGDITYGELYDYVKKEVGDQSNRMNKEQTPSVSCGSKDNSWRNIKF